MKQVNIHSAGQVCTIRTDIPEVEEKLCSADAINFVNKKIPDGRISLDNDDESSPTTLSLYCSDEQEMREEYPHFQLFDSQVTYRDALALSDYLLERMRQERGIYNLHSSTVGKRGSCVVIQGASKSGKTVLAFDAHKRRQLEFLTNERTLINFNGRTLVGGCSLLDVRDYHRKSFPSLQGLKEFSLERWCSEEYDVKCVVYPSIDSGLEKPIIELKDQVSAEWLLYPEITSRIRGVNKRVFKFTFPLDSLDTKEIAKRRIEELNLFLAYIPFYFVRGKVEGITEFIESQL